MFAHSENFRKSCFRLRMSCQARKLRIASLLQTSKRGYAAAQLYQISSFNRSKLNSINVSIISTEAVREVLPEAVLGSKSINVSQISSRPKGMAFLR